MSDIKPEKVKPMLKMITEAILIDSSNNGSLRKDVWDYIQKHQKTTVEYRDFLLAIRRFQFEGKMFNKDGYFTMHQEVITEVREKTPTAMLKKQDFKLLDGSGVPTAQVKENGGSKKSKISNSGKKQKVKPAVAKESVRQSKIQKYFMRKQMEPFGIDNYYKNQDEPAKGLGFATPAFELTKAKGERKESAKEARIASSGSKKTSKDLNKGLGIHAKNYEKKKQNQLVTKTLNNHIQQQSKRITKTKKVNGVVSKKKELVKSQPLLKVDTPKEDHIRTPVKGTPKRQPKKEILTQKIKKALKKVIETKNIRERKVYQRKPSVEVEDQKQSSAKKTPVKKVKVSKKSKAIKKESNKTERKARALKQLNFNNGTTQIIKKRLRGKTLDLTQLGVLKKKRVDEPKPKKTAKKHIRAESKEAELLTTPKKVRIQQDKVRKDSAKKVAKKDSSYKSPRKSSARKESSGKTRRVTTAKEIRRKLKQLKRQLSSSFHELTEVDRKAKLDAVIALKQLFSKSKSQSVMMDGKLIYV